MPSMPDGASHQYLRTQVMTASPAQLRLMLLDGAVKFAMQAREGYVGRQLEKASSSASQCRDIVLELATGINAQADPVLAERMQSVFLFIYRELVEISFSRDAVRLDKVIELLGYERETWALAMERAGAEGPGAGAGGSPTNGANAVVPGGTPVRAALSLEA